MANYDINNPEFNSSVRRLEANDWAHADLLNQTIKQIAINTVAIQKSSFRLGPITILRSKWNGNKYIITDNRIYTGSIAEAFWSADSKEQIVDCEIDGSTEPGQLVLTCSSIPVADLVIELVEIRNEVVDNAV